MPEPKKGARLGSGPDHQKLLLSGICTSLFRQGSVKTTVARAKLARPLAERMITFAKKGDVAARRRVLRVVTDKGVVHKLFAEIAPKYAERPGGYTRIIRAGFRKGDSAPMAVLSLVGEGEEAE
ncbi:MAG: 50S ribosomal protein L17 [Actinomycetota bacterium]